MSLEVRVHKEINAYQPKVMWGMSWRQLATAGVGIPVVGGVYAGFWFADLTTVGEWVTVLLTVPFVLFGWVRPKGLPFEVYARYVIGAVLLERQLVFFESTPVVDSDLEVISGVGKRGQASSQGGREERKCQAKAIA